VALLETRHWLSMLLGPCTEKVPMFSGTAPSGVPYVCHIGHVTHMEKKRNLFIYLFIYFC